MSEDDRELYVEEWNRGCRRQILIYILLALLTHAVAFIFGVVAGRILYG